MESTIILLTVLNAALLIAVLVLLFIRTRRDDQAGVGELRSVGAEMRQELATQRSEVRGSLAEITEGLRLSTQTAFQTHLDFKTALEERFEVLRRENETQLDRVRQTVDEKLQGTLKNSLEENARRIQLLTESNTQKQAELRATLQQELDKLRQGNEAKLEKMRETVDEKLQGTLEKRLGESFALVSERLEQVQKGLGEMQTLASDVGGLKRVLTNVKSRGGWGEVQLARQLEDMLTPDQYEENAAIVPGSTERVEFAIRLPGRADDATPVLLPIDSKFPQEDYERLLEAQESGEKADIDGASKALEKALIEQAKRISGKYISPPHSTDFAIMYLPTEGLFAEAVRRPGLASRVQNEYRITLAGPTTLTMLLNSLQMGFRTLAIEQRSSEVWQVLSAAKTEFQKYGQVWEKLGRQLTAAQKTVHDAGVRTRAVERKLRDVESLEPETDGSLMEDVLAEIEDHTMEDEQGLQT